MFPFAPATWLSLQIPALAKAPNAALAPALSPLRAIEATLVKPTATSGHPSLSEMNVDELHPQLTTCVLSEDFVFSPPSF